MINDIELGYVYKITSPTGRIYIGSTKCITDRLTHYRNYFTASQTKLHNSFLKHGYDAHEFEVIWEGPAKDRLKYESKFGLELDCLNRNNLNCKLPKAGEGVYVVSKETRKKMSTWQIGRKMSGESKKKMSAAKKGVKRSKAVRENMSKKRGKPIIQYDLKGNYIQEWRSASEAQRELNINQTHIRSCCLGVRKTTGGFKWGDK